MLITQYVLQNNKLNFRMHIRSAYSPILISTHLRKKKSILHEGGTDVANEMPPLQCCTPWNTGLKHRANVADMIKVSCNTAVVDCKHPVSDVLYRKRGEGGGNHFSFSILLVNIFSFSCLLIEVAKEAATNAEIKCLKI